MASVINRRFKYADIKAVFWLIGINFAFYMVKEFGITIKGVPFTYAFSLVPSLFVKFKMYWQPVTYMFMHANWSHIFWNMFMLFIFGRPLEKTLGSWEFLCYYMFAGIASGLLSLAVFLATGTEAFLLGASGALFGVMLLYAVAYPNNVVLVFFLIPMKVPTYVLLMALLELFYQVFGLRGGVAHLTHLFGFVAGWLYLKVRMKINPLDVWRRTYSR